jgi:PAS domain S-box-containing protein
MVEQLEAIAGRGDARATRAVWLHYGAALLVVAAATLLKLALRRPIGDSAPFLLYFGAVTLAAFFGGFGPGLLATALSFVLSGFFFLPPHNSVEVTRNGALRAVLFACEALLVSGLAGAWRRALAREEDARALESAARRSAEDAQADMVAVVESIGDPFAVLDRDWRIIYANRAAARFVSSEHGQWRGRRLQEIFTNLPDNSPWFDAVRRAMEERVSATVESFAPVRGRWFALRAYPAPLGAAIVLRDVTEQRLLEEAARSSERRFRALVERSADGIILLNAAGQLVYASPSAERILGYTAAQLTTPGFFMSALHPDDLAALIAAWTNVQQGERVSLEGRIRRPDGAGWRWLEAAGTNLLAEPAIGALVVNLRDISERKAAEEERTALLEREHAARTLAEDARRASAFLAEAGGVLAESLDYALTLNRVAELATPVLADICLIDVAQEDGEYRRVAAAAIPSLQEVARGLLRYPPTPRLPETMPRALRTGETELIADVSDTLLERAAQDLDHLALIRAVAPRSMIFAPLKARGRTLGVISFAVGADRSPYHAGDIIVVEELARRAALALDNARLYEETQAALIEAREALAMRDRFLSIASHELRTPLTSLRGQLQLGMRRLSRGAPATDVEMSLEIAHHQVNRITRLVNDLLDVSRIGAGTFSLDREPLELAPFIARLVAEERQLDSERPFTLRVNGAENVSVLADPSRLEQVFTNLLQNARKYSAANAPIAVDVAMAGDMVSVAVRDQGIGIPEDDRERVFAAFQRAGNVDSNSPGLGLGLFITRQIVRAHAGEIAVGANDGPGTTFTVTLPRLPAPNATSTPSIATAGQTV